MNFTMSRSVSRKAMVELVAGCLCLDFINTVGWRGRPEPTEHLRSYDDFLVWSQIAGLLGDTERRTLGRRSRRRPSDAEDALRRVRAVREALYQLLVDRGASRPPKASAVRLVNRELARAPDRCRLAIRGGRLAWATDSASDALLRPLWPVLWSATDLLTTLPTASEQVKECAGEGCGWLFLDTSRNGSRRWCSMSYCGNRAKASRFYARSKSSKTAG